MTVNDDQLKRWSKLFLRVVVAIIVFLALFRLFAPVVFQYMISYSQITLSIAYEDKERFRKAEELSWEMEYRTHEMDMSFYQEKCKKDNKPAKKYTWLTAMMNDNYAVGAVFLGHVIKKLSCHHHMIVLVSNGVSEISREALRKVGYDVRLVEALDCNWMDRQKGMKERNLGLPGTFMRFFAWNFTEFEKILYMDPDVVPVMSVDELFDLEGEMAASYCARPGIVDPCFNAGILMFRPSLEHYNGLMNLWKKLSAGKYCPNDQVLLWHYYADNGMWTPFPYAYNVRRHLYHPMKIYHFACCLTKKPWQERRPTRGEIEAFRGPFKQPQDMILTWWKYFNEALDIYDLHNWYEKVRVSI